MDVVEEIKDPPKGFALYQWVTKFRDLLAALVALATATNVHEFARLLRWEKSPSKRLLRPDEELGIAAFKFLWNWDGKDADVPRKQRITKYLPWLLQSIVKARPGFFSWEEYYFDALDRSIVRRCYQGSFLGAYGPERGLVYLATFTGSEGPVTMFLTVNLWEWLGRTLSLEFWKPGDELDEPTVHFVLTKFRDGTFDFSARHGADHYCIPRIVRVAQSFTGQVIDEIVYSPPSDKMISMVPPEGFALMLRELLATKGINLELSVVRLPELRRSR